MPTSHWTVIIFCNNKILILQNLEEEHERKVQDEEKVLEQLRNRRNMLLSRQEDNIKKIRDLGSLPSEAFET